MADTRDQRQADAAITARVTQLNEQASEDGIEWGHYIERHDRDGWTPLIYSSDGDREHAESFLPDGDREPFRNVRLVRRVVGDWKVVESTGEGES